MEKVRKFIDNKGKVFYLGDEVSITRKFGSGKYGKRIISNIFTLTPNNIEAVIKEGYLTEVDVLSSTSKKVTKQDILDTLELLKKQIIEYAD